VDDVFPTHLCETNSNSIFFTDHITSKIIIGFEASKLELKWRLSHCCCTLAAGLLLCSLCEAFHRTLKEQTRLACDEAKQTWAGAKGRTALAGAQREAETKSKGRSPRATATAAPSMCRIWYSMKDDPVMLTWKVQIAQWRAEQQNKTAE